MHVGGADGGAVVHVGGAGGGKVVQVGGATVHVGYFGGALDYSLWLQLYLSCKQAKAINNNKISLLVTNLHNYYMKIF